MAEFSGAINTAYYTNEEYTLIEVVYTNPNGEKVNYMVEADDNADYKALVAEGYDAETLLERTSEYKRVHARQFGELVNAQAQALAEEMLGMKHMMERKAQLEEQTEKLGEQADKLGEQAEQRKKTLLSLDQDVKVKTNKVDHALYDFIRDNNENKEELFKFKLWALEQEAVKAADKKVKSSIRKATRITEAMSIVNPLL